LMGVKPMPRLLLVSWLIWKECGTWRYFRGSWRVQRSWLIISFKKATPGLKQRNSNQASLLLLPF
jgi:hypothetical protein